MRDLSHEALNTTRSGTRVSRQKEHHRYEIESLWNARVPFGLLRMLKRK